MPRSLRWHSLWHRYRYYLYGISIVYVIVGLIAIGWCWSSYKQYKTEKAELLTLLENSQYQSIGKQYEDIVSVKNKILKNSSGRNKKPIFQNTIVLYVLDIAMGQGISLQHLNIKDEHISVDGIGHSDEACRKFIASLQQRLIGMDCHGTVKADQGIYTFHMEGSKGEHNISSREDSNEHTSVGHHH
ncbi:hypothetical protein VEIDISOL_00965 [Veillonella dispar ATCC 17748]|uniref:Fimbrial assembly protein PilN n=2 Tax=Veillonella dispar TaxID=39778 RepID=C4FPY9_9FIRM|nr:hypothetical protein VEIDISOL_00965 [Veillonella dispar ATCC 17748]MBS6382049.1 fimbrial assembly protein [Veillonella dispar]